MERRNLMFVDWINLILGLALIASPWVLGFTAGTVTLNAVIGGFAIGVVAVAALAAFAQWEELVNLALGVWVLVSPFVLGFSTETIATWTHVAVGLAVAVLAAAELWLVTRQPPRKIAS